MKFNAIATPTEADFEAWVEKVKQEDTALTSSTYKELAEPTENHPVTYYGDVSDGLFHEILMKYMKDHGSMDFYSKPNNAATGMKKAMPDMHKGHHEEVNE